MLSSPLYDSNIKEYGLLQENKDQNLRSMKIYMPSDVLCPKNFRTRGEIHESKIEQFQFIIYCFLVR